MQNQNLLFLGIFLVILAVVGVALFVGFKVVTALRHAAVRKALGAVSAHGPFPAHDVRILSEEKKDSSLSELLSQSQVLAAINARIESSGLRWSLEFFLAISIGLAVVGAVLGYYYPVLLFRGLSVCGLALGFGLVPWLWVEYKRQERLKDFEEQFPDSLDFIARALRAGHAFSVSLEMLASESQEPIRSEFRQVFNEVNLGASLEGALKAMALRLPLVDVRFFVSAILLQRETGGNLSEIMNKLSYTIRERFRLKGQVKAATAHARMTAMILTALPIIMTGVMLARRPTYYDLMLRDPDGRMIAAATIIAQVVGYLIIRKLMDIKV